MLVCFFVSSVLLTFVIVSTEARLEGPNVCVEQKTYAKLVNETVFEPYEEKKTGWCVKWPFRCPKVIVKYKNVIKLKTVLFVIPEPNCCDGYKLNGTEDGCAPDCADPCLNGTCVAPNVCECDEGFIGLTCNTCLKCGSKCPSGTYGDMCEKTCNCHKSMCHRYTGVCECSAGWRDADCSTPCEKRYYGPACGQKCPENEDGICDHVTGKDFCRTGYRGIICEQPCPDGSYGEKCLQKCACKNKAICDNVIGTCLCLPGWRGRDCSIPCPVGFFGVQCSHTCRCSNDSRCRPTDGQCYCRPGWTGAHCTETCPSGYYGDHCTSPCLCKSVQYLCDPIEGCKCPNEYTGDLCDMKLSDMSQPTPTERDYMSVIIICVLVAVFLPMIIGIIWFYYSKKVRSIKDEIFQIRYTANSFESLVENYTNHTKPLETSLPIAYKFSTKETTSKDQQQNYTSAFSSDFYDVHYSEISIHKNQEADSNNPTMKNSVNYEETKQKVPLTEEQHYTNLVYSRPLNTMKADYQLVENKTNNIK